MPAAIARRTPARSSGLAAAQPGKAALAAATAAATSAAPPRAISAIGCSPIGDTSVNVSAEETRRPPIQCLVSTSTSATFAVLAIAVPVLVAVRCPLPSPALMRKSFGPKLYSGRPAVKGSRVHVRHPADADMPM